MRARGGNSEGFFLAGWFDKGNPCVEMRISQEQSVRLVTALDGSCELDRLTGWNENYIRSVGQVLKGRDLPQ